MSLRKGNKAPGRSPAAPEPGPHNRDPRPRDPRRRLGALGEEIALEHLQARGYRLLEQNHRTRHGEIDLIVCDRKTLVFVEVKARRMQGPSQRRSRPAAGGSPVAAKLQAPLEGLSHRQRARLRGLARAWLLERAPGLWRRDLRFDAIGVILNEQGALVRLDHVEGAW
jgi:putative endonuclease